MLEAEVTWFSVWLLGVSLGLTACAVTCMPFIGTWTMGRNTTAAGAWLDTMAFLGGRLIAYGILGGLAGALGAWFVHALSGGWGNAVIGLAAVAAGLVLLAPRRRSAKCGTRPLAGRLSPFFMGLALTLIPCAPLATLLAACAGAGDAWRGWMLGSVFGFGTLLTPMLVLIPAIGGFARRLVGRNPWLAMWLRFGAAGVLVVLGARRLSVFDPLAGLLAAVVALVGIAILAVGIRRDKNGVPMSAMSVQILVRSKGP